MSTMGGCASACLPAFVSADQSPLLVCMRACVRACVRDCPWLANTEVMCVCAQVAQVRRPAHRADEERPGAAEASHAQASGSILAAVTKTHEQLGLVAGAYRASKQDIAPEL